MTRLVALACIGAMTLLPAVPAYASTASDQISTTQAIDAAAGRWFAAQNKAAQLDASIADIEHQISVEQARMQLLRHFATERAVVLYKNSDMGLTSIFGSTALDSARRAQLADDANAGGDAAIAQLASAIGDLNAQKHSLQSQKANLDKVLRDVAAERTSLDAKLAGVRAQARQEARVALVGAQDRAARLLADAYVRALALRPASTDAGASPTGPPATVSFAPVVTAPADSNQTSPHHDDPFLVCTRARESRGEYGVVSPSGYYGAYQFLPSTWDSVAVHVGRTTLVGLLPSRASEYDQDELAWALYQWQGKSPWGDRC